MGGDFALADKHPTRTTDVEVAEEEAVAFGELVGELRHEEALVPGASGAHDDEFALVDEPGRECFGFVRRVVERQVDGDDAQR
jgi:hypothetical protein